MKFKNKIIFSSLFSIGILMLVMLLNVVNANTIDYSVSFNDISSDNTRMEREFKQFSGFNIYDFNFLYEDDENKHIFYNDNSNLRVYLEYGLYNFDVENYEVEFTFRISGLGDNIFLAINPDVSLCVNNENDFDYNRQDIVFDSNNDYYCGSNDFSNILNYSNSYMGQVGLALDVFDTPYYDEYYKYYGDFSTSPYFVSVENNTYFKYSFSMSSWMNNASGLFNYYNNIDDYELSTCGSDLLTDVVFASQLTKSFKVIQLLDEDYDYNFINYDSVAPILEGEISNAVCDVSTPFSVNTIKSWFVASDEFEGNLTNSIVFDFTNYNTFLSKSINERDLGYIDVPIYVEDSSNNRTSVIQRIYVIDTISPIIDDIEYVKSVGYDVAKVNTIQELFNSYANEIISSNVSDYDSSDDLTFTISNISSLDFDLGEFSAILNVVDSSGNESSVNIKIVIYDDVKPTLTINSPLIISYNANITLNMIKECITYNDNYTSNENLIVSYDSTSVKYNKLGEYDILVSITDEMSNIITDTLKCRVSDSDVPFIFVNKAIYVGNDFVITQVALKKWLMDYLALDDNLISNLNVVSSYFDSNNVVGNYVVNCSYTLVDSNEVVNLSIPLNVVDSNDEIAPKEIEKKKKANIFVRFFRNLKKYVVKFFKAIWNFCKKICNIVVKFFKRVF